MNLVNVALEDKGAKIKAFSSSADVTQSANNILNDVQDSLWTTAQGLPQFVIISLEQLEIQYKNIDQVWFNLWHDYDTNPKIIQLWVSQTPSQQFKKWTYFQLNQKKGRQYFVINSLPADYIFLKFSIVETYGANQTYLNQIKLMAKPLQYKKQLNLEDLQSNLQQLIEMDKKISRSRQKQTKFNKKIRQSRSNRRSNIYYHQESGNNPSSSGYNDYQLSENLQSGQHPQDNTHQTNSSQFSKKFQPNQISQENSQNQDDQSQINSNAALLAISKHITKMEDNMDQIQRKVDVLDMKITVSHQNLQKSLLGKVQKMIDYKLSKVQSSKQLSNHSRRNQNYQIQQLPLDKYANKQVKTINNEFYRNKKHSDNIQNTHTKRLKYEQLSHQTNRGDLTTKPAQNNKIKTSKSIANLNKGNDFQINTDKKQKSKTKNNKDKDLYVKSLLQELNEKLKQREIKLYKLKMRQQKKRQQKEEAQIQKHRKNKRSPYQYY